ncbi:MAG: glycosyltransferase [Candidatus Micrarchaeota archaeon]
MDAVAIINYLVVFTLLFITIFFLLLFIRYRESYYKIPKKTKWEPTVSIIVPAYNEGKYVGDCIESILKVDYPRNKLDIVVVDDGSTDDTYLVAKSYEKKGVRVFTKKNGGKAAALNFGLKQVHGELVATMDADSYLTKNTITGLLPFFSDNDVMAVTPAVKIKQSSSWLKEIQRVEYLMILFSRRILSFIECVPVTPGPFSMFRASVFKEIGGFDEGNLVEDHEMALRLQSKNFKIRSSVTAEVYTEPPNTIKDLLYQRVRWQRGGLRNYWNYRYLIKPEYGDFGMYFIPLNFATIVAFFVIITLMVSSILFSPYYMRYIWLDSFQLGVNFLSLIWLTLAILSTAFVYISVKSFKEEKVKFRYIAFFVFFFWYLILGYNLITLWKEATKGSKSW